MDGHHSNDGACLHDPPCVIGQAYTRLNVADDMTFSPHATQHQRPPIFRAYHKGLRSTLWTSGPRAQCIAQGDHAREDSLMDLAEIESGLKKALNRKQVVVDHIVLSGVARLSATLESRLAVPGDGDPLPCGWHTVYCLRAPSRAELGDDGLPTSFDQIPPVPMQRRLFGGARMKFHAPLVIGQPIRCESEMTDVKTRSTPTSHLAIVTLSHRYFGPSGLAIEEEQDVIHMEPIGKSAERPAAKDEPATAPTWQRSIAPDPIMLFRFSALTFNSHRIHYDAPYSTEVEKLPGLIVQGKLIALHLLELIRTSAPAARIERFEYRSGRPLFAGGTCTLKAKLDEGGRSADLWAEDDKGRTVQTAKLAFA
jgi:3-methylfumaryl-CoA hydratase